MENIFNQFQEFLKKDVKMAFSAGEGHRVDGPEAKLFLFLFEKINELQKEIKLLKADK